MFKPTPSAPKATRLSILRKSKLVRLLALLVLSAAAITAVVTSTSAAASLRSFFNKASATPVPKKAATSNDKMASPALAPGSMLVQTTGAVLTVPRKGHTATRLDNGNVLISGGDAAGSAEIFYAATGTFSAAGNMNVDRAYHSATKLSDGRVLVTGGRSGGTPVSSTEIFDPSSGTFSTSLAMSVARAGHTATLLSDGRVLIIGGDASGTAEIYDPAANAFTGTGAHMNTARSMHSAALMQDGKVLVVGGRDANGNGISTAEVFDPGSSSFSAEKVMADPHVRATLRVLPDGKVQILGGVGNEDDIEIFDPATGVFGGHAHAYPDNDLHTALISEIMKSPTRAALLSNEVTITELGSQALVAGGVDGNGNPTSAATIYNNSSASITTDALDYPPGTTVIISGSGWQPNETVDIVFHEDPHRMEDISRTVQTDGNGNFLYNGFATDASHLGITFVLGAKGHSSGKTAQTTFTDAGESLEGWQNLPPVSWGGNGALNGSNSSYAEGQTIPIRFSSADAAGTTHTLVLKYDFNNGLKHFIDSLGSYNTTVTSGIDPCAGFSGCSGSGTTVAIPTDGTLPAGTQLPGVLTAFNVSSISFTSGYTVNSGIKQITVKYTVAAGTGNKNVVIAYGVHLAREIEWGLGNGADSFPGASGKAYAQLDNNSDKSVSINPNAITPTADLAITKADSPDPITAGNNLTYTLNVTNNGPNAANNVTVTDTLPANTTFVSCTVTNSTGVTGGTCSGTGNSRTVSFTSINAGGTATIQLVATVSSSFSGTLTNTASVSAASPTDPNSANNSSTATTTVTAANAAPVAQSQSVSTNEDTAKTITISASDANGNNLTFNIVSNSGPTNGTLGPISAPACTVNNGTSTCTATVTYTPNANYNGSDSFKFKANDGQVDSSEAQVNITVTPVNDAPTANSQSVTTLEDTPKAIILTGSDVETTSANLIFNIASQPSHGTLSGTGANRTYTPNANYNGPDSFTFTVTDTGDGSSAALTSSAATVSITVTPVNDAPTANAQSVTTDEDTPKAFTITASDVDGDNLTYTIVSGPAHGTLSGTAPNLTYTPASNYNGPDSFTFKVNDGTVDSSPATVSITVNPVNDAPVANSGSVTTPEDTPAQITFVATDVDSPSLTYSIVAGPSHGSLSPVSGSGVTYTPAPNYNGPDSFTYKANDGAADSNVATVTITVTPVNDPPAAGNDTYNTDEDMPLNVDSPGVLGNDSDVDSPNFTAIHVSGPAHGTLTLNANGSFTYTPSANYSGSDGFTYKVNDGSLDSNVATVTITINAVNDKPVVDLNGPDVDGKPETQGIDYAATFTEDGGKVSIVYLDGSDSSKSLFVGDVDSANLSSATVTITNLQDGNAEVLEADTSPHDPQTNTDIQTNITATYNPATGALTLSGVDTIEHYQAVLRTVTYNNSSQNPTPGDTQNNNARIITFVVNDDANPSLASATATSTVTVIAVNDKPEASGQSASTDEDTPKEITLSATDAEGDNLTFSIGTGPSHGTLGPIGAPSCSINSGTSTCTATVTYTPEANYNGSDSFTFKANDGHDDSDPATVSITVNPVNDKPTANAQSATTAEDTPKSITLSGSDVETQVASLTFTVATQPQHGTLSGTAPNLTYTPSADYNGPDSFTFTVTDTGDGSSPALASDAATVSITVTEVNDPPTANNDSKTTPEDTAINLTAADLTANDTAGPANESSQTLTITAVGNPGHGTASLNPNGSVTYTPAADYNGPDSFTYTITDNGTTNGVNDFKTATATVSVTVTEVNDAPTANNDSKTTAEDIPLAFAASSLTTNDSAGPSNETSQTLTVTSVATTAGTHGTVTLESGNITYTPEANYNGPASFSYTVTDNGTTNGALDPKSATGTVNVTVTEVNDAPTAANDNKSTAEDTALTLMLVDLTANDSAGPTNEGGQTLTFTAVSTASHGNVVLNPDGSITYNPSADYNGPDSFTYTITDNGTTSGQPDPKTATAIVSVNVTEVNDVPTANDDSKSVAEDGTLTFPTSDLTSNDSKGPADESSQTLTVTAVTSTASTHGTVSLASGQITYTPAADYYGPASFTYTVQDDGTTNGAADPKTATGTVNVTVTEVNDAPTTVNDNKATSEDTQLTFPASDLAANDSAGPNESSQTLTVISIGSAAHGTAVLNANGSITYTPAPNYNGPDSFTYTIKDNGTTNGVNDFKTATGTVYVTVTAVNDAPVVGALVLIATSISENDSTNLSGSFMDPDVGDNHSVTINWGDGSSNTTLANAAVGPFTASHQYLDDNPTGTASDMYTITVTVGDTGITNGQPDPKSGLSTALITVNNVAPTVGAIIGPLNPLSLTPFPTVGVSAKFTDPGTKDTFTAVWTWDDGSPSSPTSSGVITPNADGSYTVTGSYTYTEAGVYVVKLTVTDDDGGAGSNYYRYVVIYDPNNGFVTGGGWFNSQPGAYRPDLTASGKANFGFVSKYQKGATVPTGDTEFQFKAGNLNFKSKVYDWLTIAGARAQYKGSGTINGTGDYGFMLTGIDGDVNGGGGTDKLRMKIWEKATGNLVYDNQYGSSDDSNVPLNTVIGGGSIVIHSK